MKREKTVVDVEVSEDKKKEIVGSLLREHTTFGMGIERERRRQEDIVSYEDGWWMFGGEVGQRRGKEGVHCNMDSTFGMEMRGREKDKRIL